MLILVLSSCASAWKQAPDRLQGPGWSLSAPSGWMVLSSAQSEMLSIDGPYLQYIYIQERPLNQPFLNTGRTFDANLLPHEAAGIVVDNLRVDPQIRDFELIDTLPATLDGRQGFKLVYTYHDARGVEMKTIYYGILLPDRFINLRYTAAARHYFTKDLGSFEASVRSLQLLPGI